MSIASIQGATRVPSSTADSAPSGAASTRTGVDAAGSAQGASADVAGFKPVTPPRFPWLSRLSQQLESAAKQKPPFERAPVLGDIVDKSA